MAGMGRRAADRAEVEAAAHNVVRGITRPFCSCGWRADVGVDRDVAADAHLADTPPPSRPGGSPPGPGDRKVGAAGAAGGPDVQVGVADPAGAARVVESTLVRDQPA